MLYKLMRNRQKQLAGYTIIEMIIVLAIVAILTGILVPVLSNYLPNVQLNGAARNLMADLRLAQEKAITEQDQYALRFDTPSHGSYQIIHLQDSDEEVDFTRDLPRNGRLTIDSSIADNQIIFSADGGPSSSGNITLGMNEKEKVVNISPAGFIAIRQ